MYFFSQNLRLYVGLHVKLHWSLHLYWKLINGSVYSITVIACHLEMFLLIRIREDLVSVNVNKHCNVQNYLLKLPFVIRTIGFISKNCHARQKFLYQHYAGFFCYNHKNPSNELKCSHMMWIHFSILVSMINLFYCIKVLVFYDLRSEWKTY